MIKFAYRKEHDVSMNYYEKTCLTCYPVIDAVVRQIENVIKKNAKNSFYGGSAERIAEKIIDLSETRIDLIDLKGYVKAAYETLDALDKELIAYKYFGLIPKSKNFDHTSRNYFRRQVRALKTFSKQLKSAGLDEDFFAARYIKIAFINETYKRIVKEEGKKHVR